MDRSDWAPLTTVTDVYRFLCGLKINKSTGSDGISNFLFKIASPYLCQPLCNIVNSSILERQVPLLFKLCDISPIPKCYPVSEDQLRPISLLSIPSKFLEYWILKNIKQDFLRCTPPHQFAYKPKSSTTCALITIHDAITNMLEDDALLGAAIISYDFSKAFDTLPHHVLLEKLQNLNFPTGFVLWLHDYLSERQQRVRIGDMKSDCLPVSSGVPQGSLLGPFLFVVMCHDLSAYHPSSFVAQYADDTTIVCPIKAVPDFEHKIKDEISHMKNWTTVNGFKLNTAKTKCLLLGKRSCPLVTLRDLPYQCDWMTILGVLWTPSLSWDLHFECVEKKCSQRLYLLRVLKNVASHDELWLIFNAVIVNVLTYAIELFGPLSSVTRKKVQRIFKRAKRIICHRDCLCTYPNAFEEICTKKDSETPFQSTTAGAPSLPSCATQKRSWSFFCSLFKHHTTPKLFHRVFSY